MGRSRALEIAMMTPEERKSSRHTAAMVAILGQMMEYEDRNGTAMTQEQIVGAFRGSEFDAETVLFEMLDLAYVVCSVRVSPEQRSQNVQVASICYAWGTTFFGREWASRRRPPSLDLG